MDYIIILIYGLVIGSFLNVVIYRLPNEQSIISPPSHCGSCNTRLQPKDLIPVFSWIFLKGQCRYCGEKISARYALVELLTGMLFVLTYIYTGFSWVLLVNLILVSVLIAMTFIDYDHQIIPDEFHIFLIIVFVISNLAFKFIPWTDAIFGALAGFVPLFLIVLLTGGNGMGMGDVKLMFVLGLYFGLWPTVLTLFLSFIYGGFIGVLLLVTKIKDRKDAIPFGPWIALAAITALFWGDQIINWYAGMLF